MGHSTNFYKFNYIGRLEKINANPEIFYKETRLFVNSLSKYSIESSKVDRLIELLKVSDVFITDNGNISDARYFKILKDIQKSNISSAQNEKINALLNDIQNISQLKSKSSTPHTPDDYYNLIQYFNKDIPLFLVEVDFSAEKRKSVMEYLEKCVYLVSYALNHLITTESFNSINRLNQLSKKKSVNTDVQWLHQIILMWKYADATIEISGNSVHVNAITDIAKSFIVTRNINSDNRQLDYSLIPLSQLIKRVNTSLEGLGEEYFLGLRKTEKEVKKAAIQNFGNKLLLGIPIKDWLLFLFQINLLAAVRLQHTFTFFITAESLLSYFKDSKIINEIPEMINCLRFKKDLLDTPVIYWQGVPFLYLPALAVIDPVHIMHTLMKDYKIKEKWQDFRGTNFENEIARILDSSKLKIPYAKGTPDAKMEFKQDGNDHEIDIIAKDQSDKAVFVECKTFSDPFGYRDYRYELDKMYSRLYFIHAKEHFMALQNNGYKTLMSKTKKSPLLKTFMTKKVHWNAMYGIFISNFIFPKRLINNWHKRSSLSFIHWFELYRLLNEIPLNKILGFSRFHNTPISTTVKSAVNPTGFKQKSIEMIGNNQPLREITLSTQNSKKWSFSNSAHIENTKFKLGSLKVSIRYFL